MKKMDHWQQNLWDQYKFVVRSSQKCADLHELCTDF